MTYPNLDDRFQPIYTKPLTGIPTAKRARADASSAGLAGPALDRVVRLEGAERHWARTTATLEMALWAAFSVRHRDWQEDTEHRKGFARDAASLVSGGASELHFLTDVLALAWAHLTLDINYHGGGNEDQPAVRLPPFRSLGLGKWNKIDTESYASAGKSALVILGEELDAEAERYAQEASGATVTQFQARDGELYVEVRVGSVLAVSTHVPLAWYRGSDLWGIDPWVDRLCLAKLSACLKSGFKEGMLPWATLYNRLQARRRVFRAAHFWYDLLQKFPEYMEPARTAEPGSPLHAVWQLACLPYESDLLAADLWLKSVAEEGASMSQALAWLESLHHLEGALVPPDRVTDHDLSFLSSASPCEGSPALRCKDESQSAAVSPGAHGD